MKRFYVKHLIIHNQEGATPVSLALERGYHKLHRLLTE